MKFLSHFAQKFPKILGTTTLALIGIVASAPSANAAGTYLFRTSIPGLVAPTAASGTATPTCGQTDPYFCDVVLLIHGNGTNGSKTFTDTSPLGLTYTLSGSGTTAISSAKTYLGENSILFDGNVYLNAANAPKLGTADFTIEWNEYRTAAGTGVYQNGNVFESNGWNVSHVRPGYTDPGIGLCVATDTQPGSGGSCMSYGITVNTGTPATYAPLNKWISVAFTRQAGVYRVYEGGTLISSWTGTQGDADNGASSVSLALGEAYNGYVNEMRITKGVARYTGSSYTVQTAPFPDN